VVGGSHDEARIAKTVNLAIRYKIEKIEDLFPTHGTSETRGGGRRSRELPSAKA